VSLYENGIRQGILLICKELPDVIKDEIKENRATPDKRSKPALDDHLLVVLSQDCDINSNSDNFIETVVLKKVPERKVSDRVQKTINPKKLQIPINNDFWECEAYLISHISKQKLLDIDNLPIEGTLSDSSKEILLQWRINRYVRDPLPDHFNQKFIFEYLKDEQNGFQSFVAGHKENITDIYVYVRPEEEGADEYQVSITALLTLECSEGDKEKIKEEFSKHIMALDQIDNGLIMLQAPGKFDGQVDVTLEIVSEPEDFSMYDVMGMKRITLDYLCWD